MPNASKFTQNEIDESFSQISATKGIYFVAGICAAGPVNDPNQLIRSWEEFKKLYGGYLSTSDFPLLCQYMLDNGCALRINRIAHYSDVTDKSTLSATKATITAFANSTPANLFSLAIKYPGAFYNGTTAKIEAASNGNANYFNLRITPPSPLVEELYENLFITGNPTAPNSDYLLEVTRRSKLVDVTYSDISATVGQQRPVNVTKTYASGSNGGSVVAADYVGNASAKTGLYAFDGYDDGSDLLVPEMADATIAAGIETYCEGRKDLFGFVHLSNASVEAADLVTDRNATSINSSYVYISAGGHKIPDPTTQLPRSISEQAAIATLLARADSFDGPPRPFTGSKNGLVKPSLGVVTNFGGPGGYTDRNTLANAQINVLVQEKGATMLKGNFTAQLTSSKLSWANIRRYLIYLRKVLTPIFESRLENDPNHFITWNAIYKDVAKVMDRHRDEYTAIYDYNYQGDQDITSMSQMRINNQDDVDLGKYKVKMFLKPVGTINEISFDIVITATSVSFENETVI